MPEHPDRPQAVVLSSDTAFLDEWNPQGSGGAGDLIYAPGEPRGSFAAMAVATPGRGRVAVLGDHNAFSNIFLHYADNFRLALQTWDWLAHHRLGVKPGYDGRQLNYTIFMPETTRPSNVMTPQSFERGVAATSYFNLFTALNRAPGVEVRCGDRLEGEYPAVLLTPQAGRLAEPLLAGLLAHHRRGGQLVVVVVDPELGLDSGTGQLLTALDINLGELPSTPRTAVAEVMVESRSFGWAGATYYNWNIAKGKTLMSLRTDSGAVPVAIEIAPRVQLLLQATMVRNDAFRAVDGGLMSIGPMPPDQNGMVLFKALWSWLDLWVSRS